MKMSANPSCENAPKNICQLTKIRFHPVAKMRRMWDPTESGSLMGLGKGEGGRIIPKDAFSPTQGFSQFPLKR